MSDDEDRWSQNVLSDYQMAAETPGLNRQREARHSEGPDWRAPKVVEQAPCMVPSCGNLVDVTDEAMAGFVSFSKQLTKRGEPPLELGKTFCCEACRLGREEAWADKSASRSVRTTRSIRVLKGLEKSSPVDEREAEKWLEKVMGLGYVVELRRAIEEKRANGGRKPRREEL
jgi:hypothetical protein